MAAYRRNGEAAKKLGTPGDYYEVRAGCFTWYVSAETAVRIGEQLDRRWRPRWIKFADLHAGRGGVRADSVYHLAECTERQRLQEREFDQMLDRERYGNPDDDDEDPE